MPTSRFAPLAFGVLVLALQPQAPGAVDFGKDIAPILQARCIECHGPEKQKAKLRLDTKADFFKGGKNGAIVKAGDPGASELCKRITLPKTDDDRMPPADGEPLTSQQIAAIGAWIAEGAHWPDGVTIQASTPKPSPASTPDTAASTPAAPARPSVPPPERPKDFKPSAAESTALAVIGKNGVEIRPVAQGVPWKEVNLRLLGTNVTDQLIAPLKDITSLVEVRLGTTRITDAGLAALETLPHLEVLGLELTLVTDAGVARLKGLPSLVSLNLYGTAVTDAALDHLRGLKHLRNLYLWQTKVTPEGVKKLQAALPGLDINTGAELAAPAPSTNAPAPAVKKEEPKK